jgi:hypothetical protein
MFWDNAVTPLSFVVFKERTVYGPDRTDFVTVCFSRSPNQKVALDVKAIINGLILKQMKGPLPTKIVQRLFSPVSRREGEALINEKGSIYTCVVVD